MAQAARCSQSVLRAHENTWESSGLPTSTGGNAAQHLPETVDLDQLFPHNQTRSAAIQLQLWRGTGSFSPAHNRSPAPPHQSLTAVIGVNDSGPVTVDLRTQGPHALVAGTTGAGKSEFLQSWIISLAASHPPDRLVFFLMDYKGGSAFSECEYLPHTVGYMTDLTPALARRAHAALAAEIVRRERLLQECGAADLESLERRQDPRTPPNLVIVVDECAVLLRDHPAARELLHDIAQRGRSLGMHLILATQRPSGVISDQLRANVSIRVVLRVAEHVDSSELLGSGDAAAIPQSLPGRAYVRFASAAPKALQTAYVGTRKPGCITPQLAIHRMTVCGESCSIHHSAASPTPHQPMPSAGVLHTTDATKIRDRLLAAAALGGYPTPHQLWCDPLPAEIKVAELSAALPHISSYVRAETAADHTSDTVAQNTGNIGASTIGIAPVIGLLDYPHEQRQQCYSVPLSEAGNVLIIGASRSGKSTTLMTIVSQVLLDVPASWVYLLVDHALHDQAENGFTHDARVHPSAQSHRFGLSGTIAAGRGDVINVHDHERLKRAFQAFASFLMLQLPTHIRPHMVLVIDDLLSLREALEHQAHDPQMLRTFHELLRHGRASGISVVSCSERIAPLPTSWLAGFPTKLFHRVTEASEAHLIGLGIDAAVMAALVPGRAALRPAPDQPVCEAQIAIAAPPSVPAPHPSVGPLAPAVPALPKTLVRAALEAQQPGRGCFAQNLTDFVPLTLPLQGLCVVTGRTGPDRFQVIQSMLEAAHDRATHQGANFTAIALTSRQASGFTEQLWDCQTPSCDSALSALEQALASSRHTVLVIESGIDESQLTDHLSQLCNSLPAGVLVIYEAGYHLPAEAWALKTFLRSAPFVLALRPDPHDPPSVVVQPLAQYRLASAADGRGVWITAHSIIEAQMALPATRSKRGQ